MQLITVHWITGILVVLLAALSIRVRTGRRIALYLATAQIIVGVLLVVGGQKASSLHYALGLLGWGGLMASNALARRPSRRRDAVIVAAVSALAFAIAYYVGWTRLHGMHG